MTTTTETEAELTPIDTSKMSEGKREALELAEASREATGRKVSFAAELFMGGFPWELISPFPEQSEEDGVRKVPLPTASSKV